MNAKAKIKLIDPTIDPKIESLMHSILDNKFVLTQQNYDDTPEGKDLLHWIEHRLAQPHLGYLAPDQVNETWGGSTTKALELLGKNYHLKLDPNLPQIGASFLSAILDGTKPNEKPMPVANSYDWLKAQVLAHAGFIWTNNPMEMNVVGIRGYMLPHGVVMNHGNQWNDTIFVAWIDKAGNKHVKSWVATTDPGYYYYHTHPINPNGCAHAISPQQIRYVPGPHGRQQQPAFVQDSNVTVARTNAANYTDLTRRYTDTPGNRFWINLHAGFAYNDQQGVDASSAGCQTTKGAGWTDWRWLALRNLLYQDPRKHFFYTLLDSKELK